MIVLLPRRILHVHHTRDILGLGYDGELKREFALGILQAVDGEVREALDGARQSAVWVVREVFVAACDVGKEGCGGAIETLCAAFEIWPGWGEDGGWE